MNWARYRKKRTRYFSRRGQTAYGPVRKLRKRPAKKTYRRRPMNKKSLLNVTSRKKRDTMLSWSNTSNTPATIGQAQASAAGALVVRGDQYAFSLWIPTARDLSLANGPVGSIAQVAQRTDTTCFMRGLKENIKVSTNTGVCWMWRRICFKFRGNQLIDPTSDTPSFTFNPYLDTSVGMVRSYFNVSINNQGNQFARLRGILFKGSEGSDWNDLLIAPIDTTRVDLAYDKYRKISSGNANGQLRDYKVWHPMNKNLVYNDDESGDVMTTAYGSVTDKRGMGDYYVIDIVVPNPGSAATDLLYMSSTASLYWHEK